jgi:S1-C subfamily serine protease
MSNSLVFAQSVAHIPHKNLVISRADLKDAINRGPVAMRIRLVELFSGASSTPRYRVMAYDQLGPYKYLGLEVGDVILAANNMIMRQPSVFPDYVRLLSDTDKGSVHIVRKGQEFILAYTIR